MSAEIEAETREEVIHKQEATREEVANEALKEELTREEEEEATCGEEVNQTPEVGSDGVMQVISSGSERCLSRVLKSIHGVCIRRLSGTVCDVREDSLRVQIDMFDPVTQQVVFFAIIATKQATVVNDGSEKMKNFTAIFKNGDCVQFDADCAEIEEGHFFWSVTRLFTLQLTMADLRDCCGCECGRKVANIAKSVQKDLFDEWALRHTRTVCELFAEFHEKYSDVKELTHLPYQSMIDFLFRHFSLSSEDERREK